MPSLAPPLPNENSAHSLLRLRRLLILLALGVIILTGATLGRSIWRDYHARQESARHDLENCALLLEKHSARTLVDAKTTVTQLEQDATLQPCLLARDTNCLQGHLTRLATPHPQIASITLIDDEGKYIASSQASSLASEDFSEATFFKFIRASSNGAVYIGARQTGTEGQITTIPMATRYRVSDGAIGGIALLQLNPAQLEPIIPDGNGHTAGRLLLENGTLLTQSRSSSEQPTLSLPDFTPPARNQSGIIYETEPPGLTAWRKVEGWPLFVAVTQQGREINAAWQQESLVLLGAALLASLGGCVLLWHMLRLIRHQENVEDALYLSRFAVEMGADMAIWLDHHATIRYVNTTACHRLGYPENTLLTMRLTDICSSMDMGHWPQFWHKLKKHKHLYDELVYRARTGEEFPVEAHSSFVVFKGQEFNCAVVRDVSERKRAEAAIIKREQELRLALAASNTGLFDMPLDGRHPAITSPEYDRLLGCDPGTLVETLDTWKEQLHPMDRELALMAYQDYYLGKSPQFVVEYRRRVRGGDYRWFQTRGKFTGFDNNKQPTRLIGSITDITERKLAEFKITELANLDAVTGLANRNLLRDELQAAVGSAVRRKRRMAVLFLDLDRFKTVNDSLGHAAGDAVLAQVAGRLRQTLDKTDIIARLGGDEFVAVLTDISSPMEAGAVAERILAAFAEPFRLDAGKFATTTSIGISIFPDDSHTPDTLVRNADVAMYQAKAAGRNNYQFFTADMNTRATERLSLETGLRQSLVNHEFELLFQPQADLNSGHVIGAEALLRWRHPELGLISPAKFIPVAEESHMIVQIGNWVLREACLKAAGWIIAGLPPITVAVNLSPLQLHQANLLELVQQALIDSGLPPQYLELEITETVVMQEVEHVMGMLAGLKRLGVRLSIDDFGTGYSSLSYLKRFDFDKLKIDQSFVRDVLTDPNDAAIVRAIIGLGKALDMSVLAEGVETFEQLDFLRNAGANAMQGYYFSPALTHEDFIEILQQRPMLNLPESEIGM